MDNTDLIFEKYSLRNSMEIEKNIYIKLIRQNIP